MRCCRNFPHPQRRIASIIATAHAPPKTATNRNSPCANASPQPPPASRESPISSRKAGSIRGFISLVYLKVPRAAAVKSTGRGARLRRGATHDTSGLATTQFWRAGVDRVSARLQARARRRCLEAQGLSLSLRPLARLAQDEECKCSSREARSGGGLGQAALAMKPRTHFKHTIDQLDRGAETIAAVE
jgi:hypothetical protein